MLPAGKEFSDEIKVRIRIDPGRTFNYYSKRFFSE